jgi:4-hydroxybenzoate polyprenyltransferase
MMRGWLVLSRLSNLPTIWTNVLAGAVVAGGVLNSRVAWAVLAASLLYTGGMILNDLWDMDHDQVHRPTRPLVSGQVSAKAAAWVMFGMMLAGGQIAKYVDPAALAWVIGLSLAILYYDIRHKRDPLAPVVMGLCRGLVYAVAAAMATGAVPQVVLIAGALMAAYVAAFTYAARYIPSFRPWVSWAIAGISAVDALVLSAAGAPALAALALAAVPLTHLCQRVIPGD